MKNINIIALTLLALLTVSCNDFLDKVPDNRAELDTKAKITSLLVSAYTSHANNLLAEMSTDNVTDNGEQYSAAVNVTEIYKWEPVTLTGNDDPQGVWQGHYSAVATANQALQAIKEMGNPASFNPQKAEALLCRAYAMFELANIFCMNYDHEKAVKRLGLPYPTEPETKLIVKYKRGTQEELYKKINDDIETALPLVNDEIYEVPKYHFNRAAAYAFAARFNLYYQKYEKAIKYANEVLGVNPADKLRKFSKYTGMGRQDIANAYVQANDPATLLLVPAYSTSSRVVNGFSSLRFKHNAKLCNYETIWPRGPWGSGSTNNTLYLSHKLYGSAFSIQTPFLDEFFEYTDKLGGTGYPHIINIPFTTDKTLLDRAEAYALTKKFDMALKDINLWQDNHCADRTAKAIRKPITLEVLKKFYGDKNMPYASDTVYTDRDYSIKKKFHPQGFTVEPGDQENLLQLILHCKRLETLCTGERWYDIKRYGIFVTHPLDKQEPLVLQPGDLRYAIQLPQAVIDAGLEANPRDNKK